MWTLSCVLIHVATGVTVTLYCECHVNGVGLLWCLRLQEWLLACWLKT